jgi:peroxiredoxin
MIRFALALVVATGLCVGTGQAGQFNKTVNIGDAAPVFTALPGVDGKAHSLSDYKDKDVLVLCITCNHCPVAVAYEDRMIEFAKKHGGPSGKVAFVAINVNNLDADKLPKMKERAKEKGFNFDYIYDSSQKVGRDLGASVTPEFFIYNKDRKLVYMGAMDDKQQNPTTNHLEEAVTAALKGEMPKVKETRPRGCGVKYERSAGK